MPCPGSAGHRPQSRPGAVRYWRVSEASGEANAPVSAEEAAPPTEVAAESDGSARAAPGRRRRWRQPLSAGLFALVVLSFALPFASTSCTLPGGYGRGVQGTSTVYSGVDVALDGVPAVNPGDRPARPGSSPNDGQLGVQVLELLALLAALGGIALGLVGGARLAAVYAAL